MKQFQKTLVILVTCLFLVKTNAHGAEKSRPFRLGMISLNKGLDRVRPLATSDDAGFLMLGDVMIGSFNTKFVRAFNVATSKNMWWLPTEGEITSPIAVSESHLYFSTRSGHLTSINAMTGEKIWDTTLDAYSERPLTLSNGFLYVVTTGQVVYCMEAATGKRIWVHDSGFPDTVIVRRPPPPVIHDGRVLVGLASGELMALKADDGKMVWRYNPYYQDARFKDVIGELVIHNGKLLMSRYDGFIALVDTTQERQVIWQDRQTSASTSAFRGGRYFVGLTNGDILNYDGSSGRINWKSQTGATPSYIVASENFVYVISTNGRISALDIGTGEFQWGDELKGRIGSTPIVVGNRMYVETGLRNFYGYQIQ